jgi:LPXTG-motif cell wall-anchored protein
MVVRLRCLAAPLVVAAALVAPSAALAQGGAGDDQYADPFGSSPGQSQSPSHQGGSSPATHPHRTGTGTSPSVPSGAGSSTSSATTQSSTSTSATTPAATTTATGPTASAAGASSQQLPYTGADAGLIALTGALLLGGGVALRVRLRESHD